MCGKRCGFAGDALHHAAVATQGINPVVEHLKFRLIEIGSHPLAGEGHANTGSDAVAQRSSGSLDTGGPVILGMAGTFTIELPKMLDVIEGNRESAHLLVFLVHRL